MLELIEDHTQDKSNIISVSELAGSHFTAVMGSSRG
jgi:hypothetical protein